jgi:hypothetical protein
MGHGTRKKAGAGKKSTGSTSTSAKKSSVSSSASKGKAKASSPSSSRRTSTSRSTPTTSRPSPKSSPKRTVSAPRPTVSRPNVSKPPPPTIRSKPKPSILTTKTVMPKKTPIQTQQTPKVQNITYGGTPINVQATGQNKIANIKQQAANTEAAAKRSQPQAEQVIVFSEIEGNVLSTNLGIKTSLTSFVPTQQEVKILAAMEAQKLKEKNQAKAQTDWQKQRDSLDAKIAAQEAQKQKTEDFRNRSTEEILQNFIKTTIDKERTQDTGTNFTEYVKQEGFDPNQPSTIPITIFQPTKLDTVEKMAAAGVAPRIIDLRMKSFAVTQAKTTALEPNTVIRPMKKNTINYDGQKNKFAFQSKKLQGTRYVPPEAENQNRPINITARSFQPAITPKFADTNQNGIILQSVKAPEKQQGMIIQTKIRGAIATSGVDELPTKTNKGMGLALLAGVMLLG